MRFAVQEVARSLTDQLRALVDKYLCSKPKSMVLPLVHTAYSKTTLLLVLHTIYITYIPSMHVLRQGTEEYCRRK